MPRPLSILAVLALVSTGCAQKGEDTYGDDGSDALKGTGSDTDIPDLCDDIEVKVNGRDIKQVGNPKVGDEWAVRMFCQDILMTGANLLKFTPAFVAVVDDESTDAVFIQASADVTMLIQSGNKPFTHTMDVLAAD